MAGSWGVELWNCCSAAPPTHKRQQVQRRELQLVAVSAMLIDCKYEEIWAPEVNDFIFISDSAYTREQILAMEKGILNKLQWNLTIPTPYVFIMMLSASADNKSDKENAEALKFKRLSQSRQQLIDWSVKIKISKEHGGFMRFIQVSCLGASASSSRMLRAKAAGEESVLKEFPEPVYVVDVAAAIVNSLKDDGTSMGKSYGLGGPEIYTVHDLAELMYETIREWPRYIDVPLPIARLTVSSRCGILDSGGEQRGIHDNRDRQWLGGSEYLYGHPAGRGGIKIERTRHIKPVWLGSGAWMPERGISHMRQIRRPLLRFLWRSGPSPHK
uniref:Cyclin N-terminal domain-containing protein n=1 Tax=Oryza barthii TaxID=65489 RepID=A0A0D3FBP2_9ORYZ